MRLLLGICGVFALLSLFSSVLTPLYSSMKIFSILGLICFSATLSWSQSVQVSPQVFASQGAHFDNGQFQLDYTIGEAAAVSTISTGNLTLTQGFHQTDKFTIIYIPEIEAEIGTSLYPNPADNYTNLEISCEKPLDLVIEIIDATGRQVAQPKQIIHLGGKISYALGTAEFAAGTYFIRISTNEGRVSRTLKFNKSFQ